MVFFTKYCMKTYFVCRFCSCDRDDTGNNCDWVLNKAVAGLVIGGQQVQIWWKTRFPVTSDGNNILTNNHMALLSLQTSQIRQTRSYSQNCIGGSPNLALSRPQPVRRATGKLHCIQRHLSESRQSPHHGLKRSETRYSVHFQWFWPDSQTSPRTKYG
jgi:hypothetical protein